jgi:hypothetical protein
MPRSYPPPPLDPPVVKPFQLDADARKTLARALGLDGLTAELASGIAHAIACYAATIDGSPGTTIGSSIAALEEVLAHGRNHQKAVERLTHDNSGLDSETLRRLMPLALAVVDGDGAAHKALDRACRERLAELREHPRVSPRSESLRLFCFFLNGIWGHCAMPTKRHDKGARRMFAMEALTIAGADPSGYVAHPERLDELLDSDVV